MNLRARLLEQLTTLERRRLTAEPAETGADYLAKAEQWKANVAKLGLPTYHGLSCWLCNGHLQPCQRVDCPKVWRLKDCPEIVTEGRAGKHDAGGRR